MEGFREIVVCSLFQPQDFVLDGVAGRDDDDALTLLLFLEHLQQLQTVPIWQHDVEQDTVVAVVRYFQARFMEVPAVSTTYRSFASVFCISSLSEVRLQLLISS
mgnify:CR=1 FL=1